MENSLELNYMNKQLARYSTMLKHYEDCEINESADLYILNRRKSLKAKVSHYLKRIEEIKQL